MPDMRSFVSDAAGRMLLVLTEVKPGRNKVIVSEIESVIADLMKTLMIVAARAVGGSNAMAVCKKTPTAGDEVMERTYPSSKEVEYRRSACRWGMIINQHKVKLPELMTILD